MLNLTGKIALITGASSGIGSAAALMFARKGVDVALGARREERLESIAAQIKEIGRDALVVKTDVTDQDQVNRFVDLTLERFGQIDFLVANSGDYIRKPIPEIDIDTIKQSMTINFYGAVYPILRALPAMIDRQQGSIIIVNTMDAKKGLPPDAPYVSAKSALAGFGDVLRQEVRPFGIYVTTIFPGRVDTEMIDYLTVPQVSAKISADDVAKSILKAVLKHPAEIIIPWQSHLLNMANYVSPELSDWIVRTFKLEGWTQ